ncbi:MAG TPA: transaldolase [Anaerolineaceae bacterium]|nr:transaldolase [Anaerolineaceae bacterium]
MKDNPLLKLESYGQSIWMDYIRRNSLDSGELKRFIEEDDISGVTSNPSIFEKAIAGSHDYDDAIRTLAQKGTGPEDIFQQLAIEDIQRAADLFRPMYERLEGKDGFVSIEVSPRLAYDTAGTISEARRLWAAVARPNIFIKVPATREGLPAIQQLISEGINVNITLLFGLPRYREVAEAYVSGLEALVARGKPVDRIASVASFFLSRIDVLLDPQLEKIQSAGGRIAGIAASLHGMTAIFSARVAYDIYRKFFSGERFQNLAKNGARTQRLLWASTSTKNPQYSDVKYAEALIAPETIDTMPVETILAYRDHGKPAPDTLLIDPDRSCKVRERLAEVGIDLDQVTQQLEDEGVQKFNTAFEQLLAAIREKREIALRQPVD